MGSGLPSFTPDCSCPVLLKHDPWGSLRVSYPAVTVYGDAFQTSWDKWFGSSDDRQIVVASLAPPEPQGLPAWHGYGLGQTPVRSPLLRGCCLFLGVREMFQFPRCPPSVLTVTNRNWLGCPIRRSWDQCPLAAPPRLSQLCHVLLRHAAPRHQPSAPSVFPEGRPVNDDDHTRSQISTTDKPPCRQKNTCLCTW